jgi:hypothetical protein
VRAVHAMETRPRQALGSAHALFVACHCCLHSVELNVDHMPDDTEVPSIGPRIVCTRSGHVGADARPDWSELNRSARR